MDEVIAEAEKICVSELNIKLDFQFLYMPPDNYHQQVASLIRSHQPCDAFVFFSDQKGILENFVNQGIAADITELLPQFAPQIYSQTNENARKALEVNHRIYAVPRMTVIPERLGVSVRTDLLKKYGVSSIHDYDEMEAFLEKIQQNEPGIFPLTTNNTSIGLFAHVYGYVILDYETGLVYQWDDKEMKISAWEQTPEFKEAENRLAHWYRKGYINRGHNSNVGDTLNRTGKWAVCIKPIGDSIYANLSSQLMSAGDGFAYTDFSLYPDQTASSVSPILFSFVVNDQSVHKERVLMFLNWIHTNRENYRLFRYGLKDRDYTIINDCVSLTASDSLDEQFISWPGGSAMMNMNYEGPYWLGDTALNLTEYWSEICRNTDYVPHSGFVPDYTSVSVTHTIRKMAFADLVRKMEMGTYQEKDVEEYVEKMNKEGTAELVKTIQKQLDQWRTDNNTEFNDGN